MQKKCPMFGKPTFFRNGKRGECSSLKETGTCTNPECGITLIN